MSTAISLHKIVKNYGPFRALDGVSFEVHSGELHALLGQNGAGKSTLMKILYGLSVPDSGEIRLGDAVLRPGSTKEAISAGLAFVMQHFSLIDTMSVAENLMLGQLKGASYSPRKLIASMQDFIDRNAFELDAAAQVGSLSVGQKQRVEILKALYRNARFIIFDEPTAVLAPHEISVLFATLTALREAGIGIVFISHKLDEVLQVSDRITVLRDGRTITTVNTSEASAAQLARLMVGHLPAPPPARQSADISRSTPVQLAVRDLRVSREDGSPALEEISFELHAGEILGVAGIDGSGQSELAAALYGLISPEQGEVTACVPANRIGLIPQDRDEDGFVFGFSIAENCALDELDMTDAGDWTVLSPQESDRLARERIEALDVHCRGPQQDVAELSGGNRQKLLLARVLARHPRVLIAHNPTWGVDVQATALIRDKLLRQAEAGTAVLLISSDLDEIYRLCDRFFVLFRGRITGWGDRNTERSRVSLWMTGKEEGAA